jgi:hypothetical protein
MGTHCSKVNNDVIYIFGGGLKYSDSSEVYEFNTNKREIKKFGMILPKDDRFFYN